MKKLLLCLSLLILTACESERLLSDGRTYDCIGAFDDRDPHLRYKVSTQNVVVAIFFSELIAPPVIVVVNETLCPVGFKPDSVPIRPDTSHVPTRR